MQEKNSILVPRGDNPFRRLDRAQQEGVKNREVLKNLGKELENGAVLAGWFDLGEKVARLNPDAKFIENLQDRMRDVQVEMYTLDRKYGDEWFKQPSAEHEGRTVADDIMDNFRGDAWKLLIEAVDEIGIQSFLQTFGKNELDKITSDGITYLEQHIFDYGEEQAGQALQKLDYIRNQAGLASREFKPIEHQDGDSRW